jgi:transcriptional regulator, carD family
MLTKARSILTSELALARNIEKSEAAARLDAVLAEGRIEIDDNAAAE